MKTAKKWASKNSIVWVFALAVVFLVSGLNGEVEAAQTKKLKVGMIAC